MDRPAGASTAGQWLWATIRSDTDAMSRTSRDASDGQIVSLIENLFELVVLRRFSSDSDLAEITRQVLGIRQRYGANRPISIVETEMIIRGQLGERVPIDDLEEAFVVRTKLLVIEQLVHDLGLFDHELDELILTAEARIK